MPKDFEDFQDIDEFVPRNNFSSTKGEILDEVFKKAEVKKELNKTKTKKNKNKPFLKSGILLMLIAFICWIIIVSSPWVYVKTDSEFFGQNEMFLSLEDVDKPVYEGDIKNVFEPNNCSENSCSYLGLNFDDFNQDTRMIIYCLFAFIIIGLVFTIIQIIDRLKGFSTESFMLFHSLFAFFTIAVGLYLLIILVKYLGVYLLLYHNASFLTQNLLLKNVVIVFPVVLIFILTVCAIVKISFSILKMNFVELTKKSKADDSVNPFFIYKNRNKNGGMH